MAKFESVLPVEKMVKVNHDIKIARSNLRKLEDKRKGIVSDIVITFTEEEYKILYKFLGESNVDTITSCGMTVEDDTVIYNIYQDLQEID